MSGQRWLWSLFVLIALIPVISASGAQGYWLSLATRALILAIAAISLDLILGLGGLVSFGHAAFVGLGAYAAGIMTVSGNGEVLFILPAALGAAAFFALVTGALSLRTKDVAFIMITHPFGQMLYFLAQSLSAFGGDDGMTLPKRATLFGSAILENRIVLFYAVLICLIACYALASRLSASRFGRVLRAARDNPVRVAVLGYDVTRVRLAAMMIAGMIAALAGVLLAIHSDFVSPAYMSWQRSGELMFMVILGGAGSLYGAILGALAFLMMEEWLSGLTEHWKVIFGPMLILFVLSTRGGMAGLIARLSGRLS